MLEAHPGVRDKEFLKASFDHRFEVDCISVSGWPSSSEQDAAILAANARKLAEAMAELAAFRRQLSAGLEKCLSAC